MWTLLLLVNFWSGCLASPALNEEGSTSPGYVVTPGPVIFSDDCKPVRPKGGLAL